ncbi:MutS-like protein [Arcticibacter pallidicorallinus]|uniref:MutS-like protein n=1 Tax=Arcticibacter pallidicorallinus TaxID=1259464 RepID=A0A2T0TYY0_9SPHI|nr:DNA mismatch repair protein MutS [Arcticibacter pallidicorallinus]PRY50897.1 MutS-like protein [Arcticibacter pallidicorallinus]
MRIYQENIDQASAEIRRLNKKINLYSVLRVCTLVLGGFLIYNAVKAEAVWLLYLSLFLVIISFAWLVSRQSKFSVLKDFNQALLQVNENELESVRSRTNLYDDGSEWMDDHHNYTSDLDIFGKQSLYHLINRCATTFGRTQMAAWFKDASPNDTILKRQSASLEIAEKRSWKVQFQAALLFANSKSGQTEVSGLFRYLETGKESIQAWVKSFIKISPWLFYGSAVAAYFYAPFLLLLFATGLANIILVIAFHERVNKAERMMGRVGVTLSHYSRAFRMIEEEKWNSPLCRELAGKFTLPETNTTLSSEIKHLSEIMNKLDYRLNMFVGTLLNISFAWDVRQYAAILEWKEINKDYIENAFGSAGSFECLQSIAGLHINYPSWSMPLISEGARYTLKATQIGHPLIAEDVRVNNDFDLSDDLKIDIITGSNMAGKSTFLRTLGINTILALCGAPVCARSMELSNMKIFSYMRIKDSLNENISTFKAELNRLQLLLDVLKEDEKVYFLIDEMLRGTNSVDKYLGSKAIIERLISQRSVGIVATHDLQIAELEQQYPDYIRNFYFDIRVLGEEMTFDYKLKNGACKTFNASLLLRKLGIEVKKENEGYSL